MSEPGGGVAFELDGRPVRVEHDDVSLLEALRDELGVRSPKDGCSPQGQCGCCTVLVDDAPRVSCVTPVVRVRSRRVTTIDGLPDAGVWTEAFSATGASQCGFCTPGIINRLSTLTDDQLRDRAAVDRALLAHLCRCTGWQSIREACVRVALGETGPDRDVAAAARRAELEGRVAQSVGPQVAAGRGGFSDDEAPADSLVAVLDAAGEWVVAGSLAEARRAAGKVQGRRTTAPPSWPVDVPVGTWETTLQTTWVEPAYLELDAAWCEPGGVPSNPLGNGGAFGGKTDSHLPAVARRLADQHGRAVRVLWSREDSVRRGPKRPPVALGIDASGRGVVRLARPRRHADEAALLASITAVAPDVVTEFVDVVGPPVSSALRGAGWAEVSAVLAASVGGPVTVTSPAGAQATADIDTDGRVRVGVSCGDVLDETVLRSYCVGAAHMALGMVRAESIALDGDGTPLDLTVRSFGVLRAVDTPDIDVRLATPAGDGGEATPVNGSDAVFAAVLGAAWRAAGRPGRLPVT